MPGNSGKSSWSLAAAKAVPEGVRIVLCRNFHLDSDSTELLGQSMADQGFRQGPGLVFPSENTLSVRLGSAEWQQRRLRFVRSRSEVPGKADCSIPKVNTQTHIKRICMCLSSCPQLRFN